MIAAVKTDKSATVMNGAPWAFAKMVPHRVMRMTIVIRTVVTAFSAPPMTTVMMDCFAMDLRPAMLTVFARPEATPV